MKKILTIICLSVVNMKIVQASVIFSDNFNSYNNGDLVGQGGWAETTGGGTGNNIQVNNGAISLGTMGGQDANHAFSSTIPTTGGTSFYIGLDIDVSSAYGTSDYFLHVTSGNATDDRLYAKSLSTGFVLGLRASSSGPLVFGTTVLSFNTDYRIVLGYNFVGAGSADDTMNLYVNPTSYTEANNTVYAMETDTSGSDPTSPISAVNFRQGAASQGAALTADNLIVSTTFLEAVPEPATWGAISGIGLLGLCGFRAWRQKRSDKITAV